MKLRQSMPYRFLRYIYILGLYDKVTGTQISVHIGDILAPQGNISENQLLIFFRILDAQRFLSDGARDFPLQNRLSYATYGSAHQEAAGNQSFEKLIRSYREHGYQGSCITTDCHLCIMDGTHRMGMQVLFDIPIVRCRFLRRASKVGTLTSLQYQDRGFSKAELDRYCSEYRQMLLTLPCHSFLCIFPASAESVVTEYLNRSCTVERIYSVKYQNNIHMAAEFQFTDPKYHGIKDGRPYSRAAAELEIQLHKATGDPTIFVTKSITEASELLQTIKRKE